MADIKKFLMERAKNIFLCLIIVGILLGCSSCIKSYAKYASWENAVECNLTELDDGIYGYYNTVSSNIPSHNYEVITLCVNGSVRTLRGDVNIHFDSSEHKLVWIQTRYVNGDTIDVYVPQGTIEMRPNVAYGG